jgi:hypothetical protein
MKSVEETAQRIVTRHCDAWTSGVDRPNLILAIAEALRSALAEGRERERQAIRAAALAHAAYEVRDDRVFKKSIEERDDEDGSTHYTLGFPVCELSEYLDAAKDAPTIAAFLNAGDYVLNAIVPDVSRVPATSTDG